jgi:integrase
MSVIKRKRNGGAVVDSNWTVDFSDHTGFRRRVPAFRDKAASCELERNLVRLVDIRQSGGIMDSTMIRFLDTCPQQVRDRLAQWGVIERDKAAAGRSIAGHLSDWRLAMSSKEVTPKQVVEASAKVQRIASNCGWSYLGDIAAAGFDRWRMERKTAGISHATLNHYLTVLKTFCNWLVREKRILENPVSYIAKLNAAVDRRLERRAFTLDELQRLLAAAEAGKHHHGLSGHERALLYRMAVETGLRWSELYSLAKSSFNFTGDTATVTIKARSAKNRKDDILPLRLELAADMKVHLEPLQPSDKAFPGMWEDKGADMVRIDLKAAGIPYIDVDGGQGDFHALRHTFGTMLNLAGVPLATAQRLMRHSDSKLTANFYTHILVENKAEALAKLPEITAKRDNREKVETAEPTKKEGSYEKFWDNTRDNNTPNSDRFIRTYTDAHGNGSFGFTASLPKYNPLQSKGFISLAAYPIRTGDLRFTKAIQPISHPFGKHDAYCITYLFLRCYW